MAKIIFYSFLLILGLVLSQTFETANESWVKLLTMFSLSYIMIQVGYEFDLDKSKISEYRWDYIVAAVAAALPWILCAIYFNLVLEIDSWAEALLIARFASPTSAGILFSMLALAGLSTTWVFRKARVLAIFDDLDTILLMVPLKIMMVGMKWQLIGIICIVFGLIYLAWRYLHSWKLPIRWPWIMLYSAIVTFLSELIYLKSQWIDDSTPVHIEVLLPAFALGCVLARPSEIGHDRPSVEDYGRDEERSTLVASIVAAVFMVLAGLSMPKISLEGLNWLTVVTHVTLVTLVSNLGKMFPLLCYRKEAAFKERLALSIAMFPRGEVGTGVLVISAGYGLGGIALTVAALSLALNLVLTGLFVVAVKKLIAAQIKGKQAIS